MFTRNNLWSAGVAAMTMTMCVLALSGTDAQAGGMMGGGMTGGGMGGGGMGGGGMGGGGSSTVIDPPISGPLHEPAELANTSALPNEFKATLEVKTSPVSINGTTANLLTYNGQYPGPTIRVKKGDTLKVHFVNSLPVTTAKNVLGFEKNHTNLHTHGLHVSPLEPSDCAMLDILPGGGTYDYQYDLSMMYPGTLNFYHPHDHGRVAEQHWGGLAGAIVVEDGVTALKGYETHLLILKDISLSGQAPAPYTSAMEFCSGKEGNIIMVNGQVNPSVPARPGQVQRWRILNASNARFYKLSLQGHTMYVVGADGGLLDKPYPVSTLLLSPGERADILVKAAAVGSYKFLSLPYARMGNMTSPQITLMTMKSAGTPVAGALPTVVDPAAKRLTINTSALPYRKITLSMGMGRGYINGKDFDVNPFTLASQVGTYEVWEVFNSSMMDHPFHHHVDSAQVLSVSGGDPTYSALLTGSPAWKDTTIVPRGGSIKLLMPIMDFEGMAMFHCHILEHEDIGMMAIWDRMPASMTMMGR